MRAVTTDVSMRMNEYSRAVCQWDACSPYSLHDNCATPINNSLFIFVSMIAEGRKSDLSAGCFSSSSMDKTCARQPAGFAITDSSWPYWVDKMRHDARTDGPETMCPSSELSSSRKTFYLFLSIASLRRFSRSVFLNAAFYAISERAVMVHVLSPIDRRLVGNTLPQGRKKSVRRLLHFIICHFTNKLGFVSLL